jgi:casein kinase II subunit beta
MAEAGGISWVRWLLSQPFGAYFIEIDADFISNPFNLYGIRQKCANFRLASLLIRGPFVHPSSYPPTWPPNLNDYAIILYGLLHARYLLTPSGLAKMREKYDQNRFESCPRTLCNGVRCLPFGPSDDVGRATLKLFCPCCNDIYRIRDPQCAFLDGAFFGPTWAHIFLASYPDVVPMGPPEKYIERLFGYRIAPR